MRARERDSLRKIESDIGRDRERERQRKKRESRIEKVLTIKGSS